MTHHQDLGDAVVALQANASKKTHDHSGEDSTNDGPKLLQVNTHQSPDTDTSQNALHHTLGTGAFQGAPGNHVHPNYVDLGSSQNITGAKTFPIGANAPNIQDFRYANHNHADSDSGGPALATRISSVGAENLHISTVGTGVTSDFYLTNTFTLPAQAGFNGTLHANWISQNNATNNHTENFLFYISYNVGPANPVYQANHNIVAGTSDHWRATDILTPNFNSYHSFTVPVFMPPVATNTNMRISARAFNASGDAPIIAINFAFLAYMVR